MNFDSIFRFFDVCELSINLKNGFEKNYYMCTQCEIFCVVQGITHTGFEKTWIF